MRSCELIEIGPVNTNHFESKSFSRWNTHVQVFLLFESISLSSVHSFQEDTTFWINCMAQITHVSTIFKYVEKGLLIIHVNLWVAMFISGLPILIFRHNLVECTRESSDFFIWKFTFRIELDILSYKMHHHINKLVPLDLTIFILIIFVKQSLNLSSWIFTCSLHHTHIHHQSLEFIGVHVLISISIVGSEAGFNFVSVSSTDFLVLLFGKCICHLGFFLHLDIWLRLKIFSIQLDDFGLNIRNWNDLAKNYKKDITCINIQIY